MPIRFILNAFPRTGSTIIFLMMKRANDGYLFLYEPLHDKLFKLIDEKYNPVHDVMGL